MRRKLIAKEMGAAGSGQREEPHPQNHVARLLSFTGGIMFPVPMSDLSFSSVLFLLSAQSADHVRCMLHHDQCHAPWTELVYLLSFARVITAF